MMLLRNHLAIKYSANVLEISHRGDYHCLSGDPQHICVHLGLLYMEKGLVLMLAKSSE